MSGQTKVRARENFDFNWKFYKGNIDEAYLENFDDSAWRNLNVPHDWSIEGPFDELNPAGGDGGYLPTGIGWYRKHFSLSEDYKNKKIFVEFDGIYMNSTVWVNGKHFVSHIYGYTGFQYDLTPYLNYGDKDNVIAVKVDNSKQPNSRWYTGSGIYRHTWLTYTDEIHIDYNGNYITTPQISEESATVEIKTKIINEKEFNTNVTVNTKILNREGKVVTETSSGKIIEAKKSCEYVQSTIIEKPELWSIDEPYLYTAYSSIIYEDRVIDDYNTSFGIRKICFHKDKGFILNDEHVKINGVCLHHDAGCVGAAVPERILERRLEILREMGCNAIRMSHNPPSPEMLELCDKMGFLVMDEAFDEWKISKAKNGENTYGYHEYFDEFAESDLTSMLRRDRNHPSIVLWSVGNEIPEQTKEDGADILRKLVEICHREDPTRLVTSACDNIEAEPVPATNEFLEELDIVGYNYVNRWRERTETYYSEDRYKYPHRKVIGSENTSIPSIRGEYSLEAPKNLWWMGTYNTSMINAEQIWKFTKVHDYVAGDFMWTGIDYIGETRWPNKNASFGVIDMCGFPKDSYYFYQSQWTKEPMLHVFPHWNFEGSEGKIIPVICYTNCDSAELFLNGKSFGRKCYEFPRQGMTKIYGHFDKPVIHPTTSDLHLSWDVPYEPGILKVVGWKNGEAACVKEVATSGRPSKLELSADRTSIKADGQDVCNITIKVLDGKGNIVPTADNLIEFKVEGEGELIGVDNGKPDSHEDFKASIRKAFNGLALAVVQSTLHHSEIKITAKSQGLESQSLIINSSKE